MFTAREAKYFKITYDQFYLDFIDMIHHKIKYYQLGSNSGMRTGSSIRFNIDISYKFSNKEDKDNFFENILKHLLGEGYTVGMIVREKYCNFLIKWDVKDVTYLR